MLKARLHRRQEQARSQAEDRQRAETAERRRQTAEGVVQAIAAATPDPADAEDRERLTADLSDRLDRVDADRADTILPIEVLVQLMCRSLGIPHAWPAVASGAAGAEDGADEVRAASGSRYRRGRFRRVPSAELGGPATEHYMLDTETDKIFPPLPDPAQPPDPGDAGRSPVPGDTGPPPMTSPPPTDSELIDTEIRRREAAAWDRLRLAVHERIAALG
jgi:hypothetical protein